MYIISKEIKLQYNISDFTKSIILYIVSCISE